MIIARISAWLAFWWTIFAHSHIEAPSMLALFMGSIGATTVLTILLSLVQLMPPPYMRGRLISLFIVIGFGTQTLAALWIGQTAQIV